MNLCTIDIMAQPLISHPSLATVLLAKANKIGRKVKSAENKDNLDILFLNYIIEKGINRLDLCKRALGRLLIQDR